MVVRIAIIKIFRALVTFLFCIRRLAVCFIILFSISCSLTDNLIRGHNGGSLLPPTSLDNYLYVQTTKAIQVTFANGNPPFVYKKLSGEGSIDDNGLFQANSIAGLTVVQVRDSTNKSYEQKISVYDIGGKDTSFGNDGQLITSENIGSEHGKAVALDQQNRLLVISQILTIDGDLDIYVHRYTPEGNLDLTYNNTGSVRMDISGGLSEATYAATSDLSDNLYIAGKVGSGGPSGQDAFIVKLLPNGQLDSSFGTAGYIKESLAGGNTTEYIMDIVIDNNGNVLVVGLTDQPGTDDVLIARYTPSGILDTNFNLTGVLILPVGAGGDYVQAVDIDSNNNIIVAGHYQDGTTDNIFIFHMDSTGSMNSSFNGSGLATFDLTAGLSHDRLYDLKVVNDEIIIVGKTGIATADYLLGRIAANGTISAAFNGGNFIVGSTWPGIDNKLQEVIIDSDNKIHAAGNYVNGVNNELFSLKYNLDGTPDLNFGTTGLSIIPLDPLMTYNPRGLVIDSLGRVTVTGFASDSGGDIFSIMTRYWK